MADVTAWGVGREKHQEDHQDQEQSDNHNDDDNADRKQNLQANSYPTDQDDTVR